MDVACLAAEFLYIIIYNQNYKNKSKLHETATVLIVAETAASSHVLLGSTTRAR